MTHKFLEPIKVGNQTLKNRIIYMGMAKTLSGFDGKVTGKDVAYIESIAEGGIGLIVAGAMMVDYQRPFIPGQMFCFAPQYIPGLSRLVAAAHKNNAKIVFQLWHGGQINYAGPEKLPTVNEMDLNEIHRIEGMFINAAQIAIAAGADGIEFQCCHTYLANQFMSPLWNHRTDEYGCSTPENAMRFALECIGGIRKAIGPDKILAVKLQGFDFPKGEGVPIYGSDGITPDMAATFAPMIQAAGADLITVSAGGTLTGRDDIMTGDLHRAEGWKVPACRKVKASVSIPVAASGNIRHPEYVDKIISDGSCDMVGMARGLLAEHEWVKKCEEGKEDEIRYCVSCMNCWNSQMFQYDQSNCTVNPFALREGSRRSLKVTGSGRKVVIVGAGPAGLEAAVTLKKRGFEPIVLEKMDKIGGNVNLVEKPPYKEKFQWMIDYYENMVKKLNIDVRLNTEATVESILELNPYCVLIAAGSKVTSLPVEGLNRDNVYQARDILKKDMHFDNKNIVIIGGGITGMEVALYLKTQGNDLSVVDFLPEFPTVMCTDPRYTMEASIETRRCKEIGIKMFYQNKVLKYDGEKLYIEGVKDGAKAELSADAVVLSTGVKPEDSLWRGLLKANFMNVFKVGDANATAKIYKAVMNASKFAVTLK